MKSDDENYFNELYEDFKESALKGDYSDFSRDELLEVIDFADDNLDAATQLTALSVALTRYPRDREVKERMACFLYYHDENSAAMEMVRRLPTTSFIGRLLTIVINFQMSNNDPRQELDRLIAMTNKDSLGDEETIRLVEFVRHMGQLDWLDERYDAVMASCEYKDTFMMEVSTQACEAGATDLAIRALEGLSAASPFDEQVWTRLAEMYISRPDGGPQAINALNYALAINPSGIDNRLKLIGLRMASGEDVNELLPLIKALRAENPEDLKVTLHYAIMLHAAGGVEEADEALAKALEKYPDEVELYRMYVSVFADDISESRLADYYTRFMDIEGRDAALDLFDEYFIRGDFRVAAMFAMILMTDKSSVSDEYGARMIEALYRAGHYDDVVRLIDRYLDGDIPLGCRMEVLYFKAMALRRSNRDEELEAVLVKIAEESVTGGITPGLRLEICGIMQKTAMLSRAMSGEDIPDSAWDICIA